MQDYNSLMVSTLRKFFEQYDEEDTRLYVNNIGPQVLFQKMQQSAGRGGLKWLVGLNCVLNKLVLF